MYVLMTPYAAFSHFRSVQCNYLTISNMVFLPAFPRHAGYLFKLLIISPLQCVLLSRPAFPFVCGS